jgi:hypothetical protein
MGRRSAGCARFLGGPRRAFVSTHNDLIERIDWRRKRIVAKNAYAFPLVARLRGVGP